MGTVNIGKNDSLGIYNVSGPQPVTTQQRPTENRWHEAAISQLKATPWLVRASRGPEVHFEEAARDEPVTEKAATNPRRLRLDLADFVEHGFAGDCRNLPICDLRYWDILCNLWEEGNDGKRAQIRTNLQQSQYFQHGKRYCSSRLHSRRQRPISWDQGDASDAR